MPTTVGANNFYAQHRKTGVFAVFYGTLNALVVTRPSTTAVKFGFTAVKRLVAASTIVGPCLVMSVVLTAVWEFGSLLAKYSVLFIR